MVKIKLNGHTEEIFRFTLLKNVDLVSGSGNGTINLWNIEDGTVKTTLTGQTENVFALKELDNGGFFISKYH